ncbi:MAG TPA: 30S ribosomal protein S16 [Anaerolineales bacterium]|nr:30S ribosomal protein S16 [Anaerolineales bacterium]
MVRIRLRRVGSRHQPSFRVIAADEESPRDGRFLEILGHYNPRTDPATIQLDEARVFHWLGNGAQPSDSARRVLTSAGCWGRWERYKGGEPIEALLEEAKSASSEVDLRTSTARPKPSRPSKKARAKAEAEAEPAAAEAVAEAPAEPPDEAESAESGEEA